AQDYKFEIDEERNIIKVDSVIRQVVEDILDGRSLAEISAKFHFSVARLIESIAHRIRDTRRLNRVVLSGGVFQNMLLLSSTIRLLRLRGFEVFTHSRVPANDGGISLGQAVVANARLATGRI
ncbi:MAG: carbamoyltransferase HypF, partial [Pyrinomonadaceae bacterium]